MELVDLDQVALHPITFILLVILWLVSLPLSVLLTIYWNRKEK